MLQEIQLCTPPVANSIIEEYPTLMSLHKRYKQLNQTDGEYLLANLEVNFYFLLRQFYNVNKIKMKQMILIFFFKNRWKEVSYQIGIEQLINSCQKRFIKFLHQMIQQILLHNL